MLVLGASGCMQEEPFADVDYYVRNETAETLRVEAMRPFDDEPVMLVNDVVPPGATVRIHHISTAGSFEPSGNFESFSVYAGDLLIYDGGVDDDWTYEADLDGYVLTLAP